MYWAFGFAFAYGDVSSDHPSAATNRFIGFKYFFSIDVDEMPEFYASWFFQFVFAATAATIVSGAVAERCQFGAYIIYSTFITGFIYPVVTHWTWSGTGWLQNQLLESMHRHAYDADGKFFYDTSAPVGFVDFAGSAIVHCTGGIAAFMGAWVIGPRIGRFDKNDNIIAGHSTPFAALGAFILFLGFLAFNGGSELAIVGGDHAIVVAAAFVNTIIGGSAGAIFAVTITYVISWIKREPCYWSLLVIINGGLAGMVAMCAGCNVLHQGAAFGIGAMGGISLLIFSEIMKKMKIDDPLDAFAVHFGGGIVGILATPVFMNGGIVHWSNCGDQRDAYSLAYPNVADADADGFFSCDHFEYKVFAWNLVGFIAITLWAGGLSFITFFVLKKLKILRVSRDAEKEGLDIGKHGEPAYPKEAYVNSEFIYDK